MVPGEWFQQWPPGRHVLLCSLQEWHKPIHCIQSGANLAWSKITWFFKKYSTAVTQAWHKLEFMLTRDASYLTLMGKLRVVFCEDFRENWPCNTYVSFLRIWDKVIGGSLKILTYTAVAILLTFKRPLLSMNNVNCMSDYLSKVGN